MEHTHKIMIVDDNPIDQMITAHILKINYSQREIMVMESATAAIDYLHSNQDNPTAMPNLILLDLDMPEVNGFGFLDKFSALAEKVKNSCKIVVLTASDVVADIELMQADPHVVKLIAKPLGKNSLVPMV